MEVAKLAAELCQEVGLFTEVQEESLFGLEQANVIARPQKEAIEGEVLLQAPLDISDPGSFGMWSATDNNPYQPTIRDGSIYGAGAAHGKLDFLCKLKAIEDLKIKSCKNPFVLVGTFGSENGSAGAVRLIRRKKVLSQVALVGGASDLKALYAGKGMATV